MSGLLSRSIRRSKQVMETTLGEETVLMDIRSGGYFSIDAVGSRIWALLDAERAPDALAAIIASEYHVPLDAAAVDVEQFLLDLYKYGLLLDE